MLLLCLATFARLCGAQTAQPLPTAPALPVATPADSPSNSPTPAPTSTPVPTTSPINESNPTLTIVAGLPDAAVVDAYNAARTPQVSITLTAATAPAAGTSAINATASLHPVAKGGLCPLTTLQPAPATRSKVPRASTNTTTSAAQPVATVTLTYPGGTPGELVWVQSLRGGTLTATDSSGKIYDGSRGLFLTLGAAGTVTFRYQAPNVSGTYQVLTRYSNVITGVPFLVPDPAP